MAEEGHQLLLPEPAPPAGEDLDGLVLREVAATLLVYAQGRANAITGRRLAALVGAAVAKAGLEYQGKPATLARRCRAAIGELVRRGERIGSSSSAPCGYFVATDLVEFAAGEQTLRRHLIGTAKRLRAYDRATGDAVLRLLGQEPLPLPKPPLGGAEGA